MKAKDKKAIAKLNLEIDALKAREVELEILMDNVWESGDLDNYRAVVAANSEEYESIDYKINKIRDEIRKIRDADLIARGYFHELNLVRANID